MGANLLRVRPYFTLVVALLEGTQVVVPAVPGSGRITRRAENSIRQSSAVRDF